MSLNKIKSLRHQLYLRYCRSKPIQPNKVLLWADNFKSFGCSPKYIARYLLKKYPGKYDLVWVFDRERPLPEDFPEGIRVVRYFSMDYLREISTAKFIICNARTFSWHYFQKRKGQIYIQTWHSSLRLKQVEGDAAEALPQTYIEAAKADSEKIDLLLSGCRFSTEIFCRAFWYDGEILECGTPRCDLFFEEGTAIREKVFRKYGIEPGAKLALYAPTFRDHKQGQTHGLDFDRLRKALEEKTEAPWVVGCRFHPNVQGGEEGKGAVSMTRYPDMQELIAAADCLITDYSSCMFDMAVAGKPCFLYAPDLDEYMSRERGLYFDIRALPFHLCRNMEELEKELASFDTQSYLKAASDFLKETGSFEDGKAAARVAEYIEERL